MALFVLLKLLAFLSAMRNVSCDTGTCPNCQAVYANCCPGSSQPALLGAPCAICDAALNSEYTDAIPSCKLVQTTRSLWLRNYSLDHLSSTDVSHLKHLRFLHIEPGDIQHLDNNTFDGFTNLYNLSLSHNKLTYLGKQWLPEVSGHLNLAHNEIAFIEDGAFGAYDHCIETKALNLPWNHLDVIRPGYFRHLCNVMLLDLRRNRIQTIDKERERLLGSLDLAKNQIQYIESEAFTHLQLLETIDLSDNQITKGFTCCNSTSFNHSKLQNNTYNFVGKTVSSLTVSPIVLQTWHGELVSCSSLFGSGETNITAHFNVTVFPSSSNTGPNVIYTTTDSQTKTRRMNNNQIIHILDSEENGNVAINYWDLVITTLLTSSVVALSCFLILALRKGKFKLWRVSPDNRDIQDQQNPNRFSQHTYETVLDEDQYEVIPDSQVEADDVITPYGQSTIAGAYRMDTPMAATARTSHVPKHRRVDAPYVKRKRSQGRVPRDDKGVDVAESSYNLEASRRGIVGAGTRGVQESTRKAYSNAEIHVVQINNGRGDRDLTNANDLKQTYDTATDDAGHFRESERTTWL
ncbi:hypothetical protein Bbelb_231970 [Branchiostoma belcheri]|nr:hypothetical protein Bbelb_231970 [Branchiostoma belcheri]